MSEEEHEKSVLNKFKGSSVRKPKNKMEADIGNSLVEQVRAAQAKIEAG
jgi:hypothetical protein